MSEYHDFSSLRYSSWNVSYVYNDDGIPVHKEDLIKQGENNHYNNKSEIENSSNRDIQNNMSMN